MEPGSLPLLAGIDRTGSLAGCVESSHRVVSRISTCAGNGDLQRRNFARLAAGANNGGVSHHPLRLAVRICLHGIGRNHLVGSVADSVSAAASESLAQAKRI